jgi:nitrate reductase NapE component
MIKNFIGVVMLGVVLLSLGLLVGGSTGAVGAQASKSAQPYDLDAFKPTNVNVEVDPDKFLSGIVNIVFAVAVVLAFAFLVYGGVGWITSGGDKAKLETAQRRMIQALIGLLVLAAVWAIYSVTMYVLFGVVDVPIPSLSVTVPTSSTPKP